MKKFILLIILLTLAVMLFSQVEQHQVTVINVGVTARVLEKNQLVRDLTIDDFELYEDGVLQKIEAMYLVKKTSVEREEAPRKFYPALNRHFYLLFQVIDYNPKLEEAVDYFIHTVILPGDTLDIWTPVKKYNLSSKALQTLPKETIAEEMKKIIRKDTQVGSSYYRELMRDLQRLVRTISSQAGGTGPAITEMEADSADSMFGLEILLPRYRETVAKMEDLRLFENMPGLDRHQLRRFTEVIGAGINEPQASAAKVLHGPADRADIKGSLGFDQDYSHFSRNHQFGLSSVFFTRYKGYCRILKVRGKFVRTAVVL